MAMQLVYLRGKLFMKYLKRKGVLKNPLNQKRQILDELALF